jgi:hypothetical protein
MDGSELLEKERSRINSQQSVHIFCDIATECASVNVGIVKKS